MNQKQSHTNPIRWSNIYFLGIGGIGMSALARYFHANGKVVAGYDKTKTKLTSELEDLGIKIHYEDSVSNVPMSYGYSLGGVELAPENLNLANRPPHQSYKKCF